MRKLILVLSLCVPVWGQPADWKKLDFLLGKWVGVANEKDTAPGAGQGAFSFDAELNSKIIVRHNRAEYDSGAKHDDLMIVYLEGTPRAIYFDTEGHTIRYNISFPAAESVVFESDGTQPGPKYRLSYWMEKGSLNGKFEVAPPGAEYKTYMSWGSRKVN
jgi:hypothetical protein